ncbi:serine acetyltransferase [Pedobacter sp. MC2016-05]|uniref:serine O-acetyltransferase n=1 Tax=Pedobacter sp. MC2016-05 TaxID=2994474 RepID=UPI0022470E85|nr:serine acetyltransferase [Pedobacter sp. MC2016-05]MCX2473250.1 serine acetyltransferase [Pedobacter sp. MC2016-05]
MSVNRSHIFQDWKVNQNNVKGRIVMVCFRCAALVYRYDLLKIVFCWYILIYKFILGWIFNIEIHPKAIIGSNFKLENGFGTVIDKTTRIGSNCTISHLTTIGCKDLEDGSTLVSPVIGNHVYIGVNAIIIGPVYIGNHVIIGAGAVVTKNVDSYSVIGGNPAVVIKMIYKYPLVKTSLELEGVVK